MAVDPKQFPDRLGLECRRRDGPTESDGWPVADVRIDFFKRATPISACWPWMGSSSR